MFFGRLRPCFRVLYSTKNYRVISNKHKTFKTPHKINRLQLYATMAAGGSFESGSRYKNRLALEKSPYLLQHATNPVDWYPWGEEAFEKARKEGKLIFLSVGYSTCHWCHVMERESFESEEIAEVLNNNFVSVKVDREERPDVDKMYMAFVQATSGGGGWPMSVWLTPELTPVYGGTYFPPNDRYYGRPGFKTILNTIATKWKENKEKFSESGEKVVQVLQRASSLDAVGPPDRGIIAPGEECWNKLSRDLALSYDPKFGGFGEAPKFPQPVNLVFLFHLYARNPIAEQGKKALDMCLHTLKMMARGGIHDHISQGFARYSTDERWHVPHFEKMLYDQAQLTVVYSAAFLATKDPFYADIVRDILTYVNRDLSHKSGGFYSAEDADSYPFEGAEHKKEGAFCVWTHEDVQKLLADKKVADSAVSLAEIFCHHYNVLPKGNVNPYQDPHEELKMQNVLIVLGSEEETAEAFSLEISVVREALSQARAILYEERQKRPRPHLDDKMLTSWNGLMISGFAKAGQALQESQYIDRAIKAANFVKQHLYNKETGLLLRSCYTGSDGEVAQISSPINGFLDDYAFLIRGLIDLYESCFDVAWLEWAKELQDQQDRLFWDDKGAGYFTSSATDSSILIRLKEDQDGAEPSGNSVACSNLLRLAALLDKPELRERAGCILSAFSTRLTRIPIAVPELTSALLLYHDTPVQVLLAGSLEDVRPLLAEVHTRLLPGRVLALADGNTESLLYRVSETVSHVKQPPAGQAAAYVCRHSACSLPVSTPQALAKTLTET